MGVIIRSTTLFIDHSALDNNSLQYHTSVYMQNYIDEL